MSRVGKCSIFMRDPAGLFEEIEVAVLETRGLCQEIVQQFFEIVLETFD